MAIRVLFISHDSTLYGAQLSLLDLLKNIDRSKIEPYLIAPYEGPLTERARALKINVSIRHIVHWMASGRRMKHSTWRRLSDTLTGVRTRIWAIAAIIEREEIQVVYTNTVTCIEGALAAHITKRTHIWHLREAIKGNKELIPMLPPTITRWIISFLSDKVIFNSQYLANLYGTLGKKEKAQIIYNGINTSPYFKDSTDLRIKQDLNLVDSTFLVSIIGALHPRKRVELFISAAHIVNQLIPNTHFLVVGTGPPHYVATLKKLAENYSLQKNIHFIGWRKNIGQILNETNTLVVAADQEPFGRTIIEAMARKTPVVATRSGGPEEIILDKETGFLVPIDDSDSLASSIIQILKNPMLAECIAEKGYQRAKLKFDINIYIKNIEQTIIKAAQNSHD